MGNGPLVGLAIIVALGCALAAVMIIPILLLSGLFLYSIFTM